MIAKRTIPLALLLAVVLDPPSLPAQALSVGAARWLTSPWTSEYRLGVDGFSYGPFSFRHSIQYLSRGGESRAAWGGVGSDAILRTTPSARPYLVAGAGVGLGRPDSLRGLGPALGLWGGAGAELFTIGSLGLQAEALYTWRGRMGVNSISIGLRAGTRIGRTGGTRARFETRTVPAPAGGSGTVLPQAAPGDEDVLRRATGTAGRRADGHIGDTGSGITSAPSGSTLMGSIVGTALGAMGTPYRWGGSSGNGFDCSGLIQYSFAQHGIALPRRSVDQARAGEEIGRRMDDLAPGDILTFSTSAGSDNVTHVGLYLGEGRFIHSATAGVQVSVLSQADSIGQWWWDRWVGARRVSER